MYDSALMMLVKQRYKVKDNKELDQTSCHCQEYEKLAAQLDGARGPLAKKVQHFSGMNNTKHLVEMAEEHAELLNIIAMNLSR